jgi:phosphoglycolate phosphatase
MAAPLVIFDLDGTLVDSAPDLVATLNTILARQGLPGVAYEQARNMVGGGARAMLERGLAARSCVLPSAELDRLTTQFVEYYGAHLADSSKVFPGVEAALDVLAARGFRFAVCTNKLEWLSVRLLDALGLTRRFDAVCGADTFKMMKPDPEVLRCTIARCGLTDCAAVVVGDSNVDVAAAQGAGLPVVLVDFGYTLVPARELGADRVISRFADLPEAVSALIDRPTVQFAGNS